MNQQPTTHPFYKYLKSVLKREPTRDDYLKFGHQLFDKGLDNPTHGQRHYLPERPDLSSELTERYVSSREGVLD